MNTRKNDVFSREENFGCFSSPCIGNRWFIDIFKYLLGWLNQDFSNARIHQINRDIYRYIGEWDGLNLSISFPPTDLIIIGKLSKGGGVFYFNLIVSLNQELNCWDSQHSPFDQRMISINRGNFLVNTRSHPSCKCFKTGKGMEGELDVWPNSVRKNLRAWDKGIGNCDLFYKIYYIWYVYWPITISTRQLCERNFSINSFNCLSFEKQIWNFQIRTILYNFSIDSFNCLCYEKQNCGFSIRTIFGRTWILN